MVQIKALCNIDMVQAHHKQDISSNPQRKTFTPQKKIQTPPEKNPNPPEMSFFACHRLLFYLYYEDVFFY